MILASSDYEDNHDNTIIVLQWQIDSSFNFDAAAGEA